MTLLIVEHDKAAAYTLCEGLARDGHTIATVTSGAHALRAVERNAYDACLLADDLPDTSLTELVRALHDVDPSLKTLALLSSDVAPHTDVRTRLDADASLAKPFSLATVRASVVRLRDRDDDADLQRAA